MHGVHTSWTGALADLLLEGIPVLDLLEITCSTTAVAQRIQRDQSSVSRIYRHVSQVLNLGFQKRDNGLYQAQSNQPLLASLRLASQQMRLAPKPGCPRWLHTLTEPMDLGGVMGVLPAAIPLEGCRRPERLTGLLQDRLLDLAMLNEPPVFQAASPLTCLPLITPTEQQLHAVLRQDLVEAPAIQELLSLLKVRTCA